MSYAKLLDAGTRILAFGALLILSTAISPQAHAAATLAPGFDAAATLQAGARFRNLGNSGTTGATEVWVYNSFPPTELTSTTRQLSWLASQTVTLAYDATTDILSATVGAATTTRNVGDLGPLNYVEINITKNAAFTSISWNSISLNGGGSLGSISVSGGAATSKWMITGADLTGGFSLSGTFVLTGLTGGGDSNFLQVDVGHVVPPDTEGPVTSGVAIQPTPVLINGDATVTANVDDSTTGNNTIKSAEYSLNGGTWTAMAAQDGDGFNEVNEDVTATFTATTLGPNEACVRGTDVLDNTGDAVCQTFLVTYDFTGFFPPIDNTFVNIVKAGQAIPAKWRLTDALGNPISSFDSFAGLFSYPISCTEFSGDPTDNMEEVASGNSGLQYLGDGYWQFNWKTSKNYADTCRAMYVQFDSGAMSPVVKFQFRK